MAPFVLLVGSMTGNAEFAAEEMVQVLKNELGREAELRMMDELRADAFQPGTIYLICTSTYGEGEVPENAKAFYAALCEQRPDLSAHYRVPEHFGPDWFTRKLWPFTMHPDPHGILIGPRGAFTKLHYDLWGSHSWNAQIVGRKEWVFIEPRYMDDVYIETRQNGGYVPGTDIEAPDLAQYPRLGKVPYYKVVVHPGEMVYFPSLWMHQVTSLDDTISVTHNYLSGNIYWRVLGRYLAHRYLKKQGI